MRSLLDLIRRFWSRFLQIMEDVGEPCLLLAARLMIGADPVGLPAGRLEHLFAGAWGALEAYFRSDRPLPVLPHGLTAPILATLALICGALLTIGWLGRGAAFGLLLVIGATAWSAHHAGEPIGLLPAMKALLLGMLIVRGAGALSVDRLTRRG